jgi:20S proteasome alpha/beta subunit
MTVILGLRCAEGLLLATDTQATAQIAGGVPVKEEAIKVERVGPNILMGGTGAQGCSQRVSAGLNQHLKHLAPDKSKAIAANVIHQVANQVQKASRDAFVQYGQGAQPESWGGIFVGWSSDGPWIVEVDLNGGWQFHERRASTGSGYAFASLAMGFVRHHDVPGLNLDAAKAIAYRAIETTCLVSAYGVGLPVQMGVVTVVGATVVPTEEIRELEEFVNLWRGREREVLGALVPQPDAPDEAPGAEPSDGLDAPQ